MRAAAIEAHGHAQDHRPGIRRHHGPGRVPAVPGAAAARQIHPALVRRQRLDLDRLSAVLPGGAAGRLCACLRHNLAALGAAPGAGADRHPGGEPAAAADHTLGGLETAGRGQSDLAHPGSARADGGRSLYRAGDDDAVAVALARTHRAWARSGAFLRRLQPRRLCRPHLNNTQQEPYWLRALLWH